MKKLFLRRILLIALLMFSAVGIALALTPGHAGGMSGFGLAYGYPLGLLLLVVSTVGIVRVGMRSTSERRTVALLSCLGLGYAASRWPPGLYHSDVWRAPGENFLIAGLSSMLLLFLAVRQECHVRKAQLGSTPD